MTNSMISDDGRNRLFAKAERYECLWWATRFDTGQERLTDRKKRFGRPRKLITTSTIINDRQRFSQKRESNGLTKQTISATNKHNATNTTQSSSNDKKKKSNRSFFPITMAVLHPKMLWTVLLAAVLSLTAVAATTPSPVPAPTNGTECGTLIVRSIQNDGFVSPHKVSVAGATTSWERHLCC
jgi:hypothetical protein